MDKAFFENIEQRKKEAADRTGLGDDVRAVLILGSGRSLVLDRVVEAGDAWIHVDGHDAEEEDRPMSVVMPYYQIAAVVFDKQRPRSRHPGFSG
jgi:hypothetical protein